MDCCSKAKWKGVAGLDHLLGDFDDRGVTSLWLERCGTCKAYQLGVEMKGRRYLLPLPKKRGERMLNADRMFWKRLHQEYRS